MRLKNGKLLVPVLNMDKMIQGLQFIDNEGVKRFTHDCEVKNHFYVINGQEKIAICEGYATASSVHEATCWTTVTAFNKADF